MNRRSFLRAVAALPVVAALAPLVTLPKPPWGATAATGFRSTSMSFDEWLPRSRYLRYRYTMRSHVSAFSEPIGQLIGDDAIRQTLYVPMPCDHAEHSPCDIDIEAQVSDDGVAWRSADASLEVVRV